MNVYYFHHQADELLGTASEQFLGKTVKEIKQTILQTLEGHLRAILGWYFLLLYFLSFLIVFFFIELAFLWGRKMGGNFEGWQNYCGWKKKRINL